MDVSIVFVALGDDVFLFFSKSTYLSWEIAAMLANVVVVGVHRGPRGARFN